MTHEALIAALRARNVIRAEVEYSGGNDSGGADRIVLHFADGHTKEPPCYGSADPSDVALSALPDERYGSWAGEFHAHGTVTVDVKKGTVHLDGSESHDVWDDVREDLYTFEYPSKVRTPEGM